MAPAASILGGSGGAKVYERARLENEPCPVLKDRTAIGGVAVRLRPKEGQVTITSRLLAACRSRR